MAHESHSKFLKYDTRTITSEKGIIPVKGITRFNEKYVTHCSDHLQLLQCPVCKSSMHPPIRQCPNGHTMCTNCNARVQNQCPWCRCELGDIRCSVLEKVAESMQLPCKYQSLGCHDVFPYYNKAKHEQSCHFRPFNCPYVGSECSVSGDIASLVDHLKDAHQVDLHEGCTINHRYVKSDKNEVGDATWMLTVFNCSGKQFCLHFEAFKLAGSLVYIGFLRFMGEDREGRKYRYRLEVGGFGRKLAWEGIPRSIRESHTHIRDSLDGLIISRKLALFFSGDDKQELRLRVRGRIWKTRKGIDATTESFP